MKKFIFIIAFIVLLSFNVFAEQTIYEQQYLASGMDNLYYQLTQEAKEIFDSLDISFENSHFSSEISTQSLVSLILNIITGKGVLPLVSCAATLAVVLISSLSGGFLGENTAGTKIFLYASSAAVAMIIIVPVMSTISACVSAIKGSGVFMTAFVPAFAGVMLAMGKAVTSAGFATLLIAVSQLVTQISSFVILPVVCVHLAISLCSAVSINLSGIGKMLKKFSVWTISFIMTVFLSVLGIQNIINSATDSAATKTAKFIVTTTVPVVGSAVSEAINSVQGCLSVLKSSAGVYGIIGVGAIFLPVIIEILLWRIGVLAVKAVSEIIEREKTVFLLNAIDTSLSLVLSIVLCICIMFIVSLTVVMMVGGRV